MSAIDKAKQAIAVAEKFGFQSIISIEGHNFSHMPAGVHLANLSEIQHMDYEIEGDNGHYQMYVLLDGVKVYSVLNYAQYINLEGGK